MSIKILKVCSPAYHTGSYSRNPAYYSEVEFSDGKKVVVRSGDGETIACGLRYQEGMPQAEYGRLAIEAIENES